MLLFFHVFPLGATLPRTRAISAAIISMAATALLSLSPWVVTDVVRTPTGLSVSYGPLYILFAIHILWSVTYSLGLIVKKARSTRGHERQQLKYLFLALAVPGVFATITNLLVPLITGNSHFGQYGPLFSVAMIGIIAHSIIRHRLMDIRLVIRQGVVYLIAAVISGAVFASIIGLVALQTSGQLHDVPLPFQVAVALSIALAFQPLKYWIQARLDQYVYRESYNYQAILRDSSRTVSATLDLGTILRYLCEVTTRSVRPEFVAVFTYDRQGDVFTAAATNVFVQNSAILDQPELPASSPLPTFLSRAGRPIARDEVHRGLPGKDAELAAADLSAIGGDLAFPMLSENRLVGLLVVGPKLSGDAYFKDDLELLSTLSNQAAIAVNNAQLYRQVLLANEQIQNILRTMDSGVITVDARGYVAVCNSTAETLTSIPLTVLTSLHLDQLPPSLAVHLRSTLLDGASRLQIETTLPVDPQRLLPIVCSTSALRDSKGDILGALVVFTDLSKLKALESEKRRAERLAAFGTLVSGIAHEIKNPLVAIKTFAELLPERFAEADFREDFAKVVITEIDRIDDLVLRLRGLAAPSPLQGGPIDIREPIADTLALLRGQIERSRTVVERHLDDPEPLVAVDSAQLKQLFLNLCINAIEAMGPGGHLTLRVGRRATAGETWIVAEVSDTGPGIPDAIRAHIFDPFFTTKPRGSGLGLAICRGITDAHRGTIRAESNATTGTTIVVEFPASARSVELTAADALRS